MERNLFLRKVLLRAYILCIHTVNLTPIVYSMSRRKGRVMGMWLVRTEAGAFKSFPASDSNVVHLLNSGMNICIIGPTTSSSERTEASGMRGSSTERKPAPSPDT